MSKIKVPSNVKCRRFSAPPNLASGDLTSCDPVIEFLREPEYSSTDTHALDRAIKQCTASNVVL
jgi:hypothetical protein